MQTTKTPACKPKTQPERAAEAPLATKQKQAPRFRRSAAFDAFVDFGIANADLTPAEALVWVMLFRGTGADGTARAGQAEIARRSGLSVRTVKLAIRVLKAKGMAQVVHRGRWNAGPSTYRIHPTGQAE